LARKKMYRHEVGHLPENQTMKMKGKVRHGWHKAQYSDETKRKQKIARTARAESRWGI
jgi:hypothetical protein